MNIVFICQYDPVGNRGGGIGNYINNFIRYAPDNLTFKIIGVSNAHPLNQWIEIDLYGKKVLFMSLVKVADINKKELIPLSLVFTFRLIFAQKKIAQDDIIYCQRSEYVYPFFLRKNIILSIIHNDITLQLDREISDNSWALLPQFYLLFQNIAYKRSDHVFSVNHNSIALVCDQIEAFESKISFVHTWADPVLFRRKSAEERARLGRELSSRLSLDATLPRLLFVGRFQKQKNIPRLLKGFLAVKDQCALIMAGTGAEFDFVQAFIDEHALDNQVKLLGNIPHNQIPDVMAACQIYVSSSNFEGMSIALMEALSAGMFVVTTDTGEAKFLLTDDTCGIIAADFTEHAFAEALAASLAVVGDPNYQFSFDIGQFSPQKSIQLVLDKAAELIQKQNH